MLRLPSQYTVLRSAIASAPLCLGLLGSPAQGVVFPDSSKDIHSFAVFDYHPTDPTSIAPQYDFVWSARYLAQWNAGHPGIVLSFYTNAYRTNSANDTTSVLQNHSDWVLRDCDQSIAKDSDGNVLLDPTNTAAIDWEFNNFMAGASGSYGAIALDELGLDNVYPKYGGGYSHVCGTIDANGIWVQKFSGIDSYDTVGDPQWTDAVIQYVSAVRARLQALPQPLGLVPNSGMRPLSHDPARQAAYISAVDAVLDEGGSYYEDWTTDDWYQKQRFIESIQASGKGYYMINEYLVPSASITDVPRSYMQFVLASYLLSKGIAAGIFVGALDSSGGQPYGTALWYPEFNAPVGTPCGPMSSSNGVYSREHSGAMSLVNPNPSQTFTVPLPSAWNYKDLYGNAVASPVTLSPTSGVVLLKTGSTGCSSSPPSPCDVNQDGTTNVVDVQLEVNEALGINPCVHDINRDGVCNIIDVQRVVNAALGGQCASP